MINKKGVTTSNVYDFYIAEGKKVRSVSRWTDFKNYEVEAAVEFEKSLAKKYTKAFYI